MAVTQAGRAGGALCISEKWIRKRLNLQLDSLEDVRSLALPGSYQEKVTHLGRALLGFTRLKHLDLSRNAIESLEGLEHLKHLESLNLYYNNVATLKELFRLRHNKKLKELDLRLNPVTKNELDYRLFVVHMLVNLRKLDDRGVRDGERKAALMHFDTDQAHELAVGVQSDLTPPKKPDSHHHHHHHHQQQPEVSRHIKARTQLVQSLAPRPTGLDDDTDELLDLISRNDDMLTPVKNPHSLPSGVLLHKSAGPSPKYASLSSLAQQTPPSSSQRQGNGGVGHKMGTGPADVMLNESVDHNLEFVDEYQAYTDHKVKGNFTPAPPTVEGGGHATSGDGERTTEQPSSSAVANGSLYIGASSDSLAVSQLLRLLQEHIPRDVGALKMDATFRDKVSRWLQSHLAPPSGLKTEVRGQLQRLQGEVESLQQHLEHKDSILQQKESELTTLQSQVRQRESEAAVLGQQLQRQTAELEEAWQGAGSRDETHRLLQQANTDVSSLREHVQSLQEESSQLKARLEQAPSATQLTKMQKQITQLRGENSSLRVELEAALERHQQDLQCSSQVQELAAMLQESHRSLVATNDHLLRELEETKQRHTQEVMQMSLNYEHLRRTVDFIQSTS